LIETIVFPLSHAITMLLLLLPVNTVIILLVSG